MFIIRDAQIAALIAPSDARFFDYARVQLQRLYPEECALMTPAQLQEMMTQALVRANTYGLKTYEQGFQFITSTLLLGDDFDRSDEYPWAPELLGDEYRAPSVKVAMLRQRTLQAIAEYMAQIDAQLLAELDEASDDGESIA